MSWHTPEERFAQHLAGGILSSKWVFNHQAGARLRPEFYRHFNPMHKALAQLMEVERARQLRAQGFAVWQR